MRYAISTCATNYNNYRYDCCACTFAVCSPLRSQISSLLLQHPSLLQCLAAAASKAEPRLFEPSLRVTTDPATPFRFGLGSLELAAV